MNNRSNSHTAFLLQVLTYALEIWSTTKIQKLMYEKNMLRRIFESNLRNGKYRTRINQNVQDVYNKSDIYVYLKSKRPEWAGHAYLAIWFIKLLRDELLGKSQEADRSNVGYVESKNIWKSLDKDWKLKTVKTKKDSKVSKILLILIIIYK